VAAIQAQAQDAIAALDAFAPSPSRDALIGLAQREIDRSL
jgi:hypothetical protein